MRIETGKGRQEKGGTLTSLNSHPSMLNSFPETQEEIQAAARTPEWQALADRYRACLRKNDALSALRVLATIRSRFGPRMAEGLAEWEEEE